MSQLFTSGGQSIGASASASVLPVNIQSWFSLRLTALISLQSKGLSRVFSKQYNLKESVLWHSTFCIVQLSHPWGILGELAVLGEFLGDLGNQADICIDSYASFYESFLCRRPGFTNQYNTKPKNQYNTKAYIWVDKWIFKLEYVEMWKWGIEFFFKNN